MFVVSDKREIHFYVHVVLKKLVYTDVCLCHLLINTSFSFIHSGLNKIIPSYISIAHMPHIDIPILAVCRMFVPWT